MLHCTQSCASENGQSVGGWAWSSYRSNIGEVPAPKCLSVVWLLPCFGKQKKRAIDKYKAYVADGNGVILWDKKQNQVFLGSEKFIEEKKDSIEPEKDLSEIAAGQKSCDCDWQFVYSSKTKRAIAYQYNNFGQIAISIHDFSKINTKFFKVASCRYGCDDKLKIKIRYEID